MTAQVHENLIIGCEKTSMAFCPPLPENDSRVVKLKDDEIKGGGGIFSTACWRQYIGTWQIIDNKFYLVNLEGRFKLASDAPVFANWFTGTLRIPQGEMLHYVHMGFGSVYEREKHIKIEKGIVTNCKIIDNRNKNEGMPYFNQYGITSLWHMTHVNNVSNILNHGILNHYNAHKLDANLIDISDYGAQRWRESIEPHYKRKIHDYAALYINPRNPMLYVRRHIQNELCLLEISLSVLSAKQYLITDGNAASRDTQFYNSLNDLEKLPWDVLQAKYWAEFLDGKRKRCAEVLIYPEVEPNFIFNIHCCSHNAVNYLSSCQRNILLTPNLFF